MNLEELRADRELLITRLSNLRLNRLKAVGRNFSIQTQLRIDGDIEETEESIRDLDEQIAKHKAP